MERKLPIYLMMGALLISSISCEEMLEVKPRTSLAADDALSTLLGVEAALNGVYGGMRGGTNGDYYGNEMITIPEVLADNMKLVQAATRSGRGVGYNTNSPGYHIDIWSVVYKLINRASLVIEAADKVEGSASQIASIKAQAYFLRGVLYFDLVKSYGYNPNHIVDDFDLGVPILPNAVDDLTKVTYPSRNTVTEVYAQIESDFLTAINLFSQTTSPNTGAPYYATKGATHAMLSRLYLYWAGDKYDDAVTQAGLALGSGVGTFQPNASYVSMWAAVTKPESMYEIQFNSLSETIVTPDNNSIQAYYQQKVTGTQTIGFGDIVISDDFMAQFEANDVRKQVIIPYVRSNGEQVQQTNKFQGSKGTFGWDNVPVIRISEVYLNRAEALAMSGNEGDAQDDLNLIRTRAGLTEIFPTGTALIEAILKERRLELAFEGQRWFDLTRLGKDIPKSPGDPVSFDDYRILPQLPQADLQVNTNLTPNPGY